MDALNPTNDLDIEGLAAQLYVTDNTGRAFAWWHVMRDDIREEYRAAARRKIEQFNRNNADFDQLFAGERS